MSKPQMDKVGADRAFQNPQAAVDSLTGTYRDEASEGALSEKLATVSFPMVPCASKMTIKTRASGGR